MSAKASPKPNSLNGTSRSATWFGRTTILAAVMTDKATVEIPSPVDGEIIWLGAEVGDVVAVGSDLVRLKVAGEGNGLRERGASEQQRHKPSRAAASARPAKPAGSARGGSEAAPSDVRKPRVTPSRPRTRVRSARRRRPSAPEGEKPLASPAVRLRAREAGIDLRQVPGTGPAGRITHEDLDAFVARGPGDGEARAGWRRGSAVEDNQGRSACAVGSRRGWPLATTRIPHITYVEEVDVTALEELRTTLNADKRQDQPRLTLLPFLMRAMVRAIAEQPNLNALFDDEAGIVHQHAGVHIGIAAQTSAGLLVPVVRHAEALDLWGCAAEVEPACRSRARQGTATREELSGSTITITSLGAMGGVVTTPIINHPEVAIIGVNKMMVRPVWDGSAFIPRKMMNLSSSFDHRVIDG